MKQRFSSSVILWLIIAITAGGAFLRFWDLQSKPFMHDESLFAYFSYCVYPLFNYRYDPLLHGPMLEHLTALLYFVFGDTNFTARFWPAFLGTICIFLCWPFRRQISLSGAIACAAMICLSPTLLYYSRFLRNDIFLLFFELVTILFFIQWQKSGRPWAGFSFSFFSGLLICIKENAIFFYFTCVTFFLLTYICDFLAGVFILWRSRSLPEVRPSSESIITFIHIAIGNCLFWIFMVFAGRRLFIDSATGTSFIHITHHQVVLLVLSAFCLLQVFVCLFCIDAKFRIGRFHLAHLFTQLLANTWMSIAAGLFMAMAMYIVLFTTLLHFQWGFFQIYRTTLQYWAEQNALHRLKGPFHYYLFRILVYETLPLLIAGLGCLVTLFRRWRAAAVFLLGSGGIIVSVFFFLRLHPFDVQWADQHLHLSATWHLYFALLLAWSCICLTVIVLGRGRFFDAFLIWWALQSLLQYSYAGEKVPWIGVHITAPLIFLAALEAGRFWQWTQCIHITYQRDLLRYIFILLFMLLFVRGTIIAIQVAFVRNTDAGEMLVYNHTTPEFLNVVHTINRVAVQSGEGKKLAMSLTGEALWPLNWYMRHYDRYLSPENLSTTQDVVIIANENDISSSLRDFHEYEKKIVPLRQAWVPDELRLRAMFAYVLHGGKLESVPAKPELILAGQEDWRKFWNYFLWQSPWLKKGETSIGWPYNVVFLLRKDYLSYAKEPAGKLQ